MFFKNLCWVPKDSLVQAIGFKQLIKLGSDKSAKVDLPGSTEKYGSADVVGKLD